MNLVVCAGVEVIGLTGTHETLQFKSITELPFRKLGIFLLIKFNREWVKIYENNVPVTFLVVVACVVCCKLGTVSLIFY